MDIQEFFDLSTGKWFSQRTSHNLGSSQSENAKSDLTFELMAHDHPIAIELCQKYQISPTSITTAAQTAWKGSMQRDKERQEQPYTGTLALVAIADSATTGRLVTPTSISTYEIGTDGSFALTAKTDLFHSQERIWFASPNLRLRTILIEGKHGFSMSSLCSEIRMGGARPN